MADAAPVPATAEKKPEAAAPRTRFTARLRYARISARKMRYVVDLIRGKDYNNAVAILRACSKRGAMFCKKLLESAYGNAINIAREKNLDIDGNKLHVIEARVDPGPIIKRWRPSSVRRPNMIKKRLCHVVFTLEERDLKETRKDKAKRQKQDRQKQAQAQKAAAVAAKPPASSEAAAPKKPLDESRGKEEKK
ncbi:MAG TPA: 50S ribosomal protein L22 [Planctomycetota bacterium]|nr:50S ribosomal protein L22 [Planctomycetota bacterium]